MSTESGMGSSRRNNSGAELASTTQPAVNRDSLDHIEEQNNTAATMGSTQGSSTAQQSDVLACQISGNLTKHKVYLQQQEVLLSAPGDPVLENYTKATLTDGRHTVAGIDTTFKAHSTRCAAVSKANVNGLHIDDILKTAGWSSEWTFAKFYNKSIKMPNKSFATVVLESNSE
ncbi:Tyrosine recombinase [Paramuricea clavata]|uniref:Tyrosine recombinase, partial n=1 Tax=Paramuricea clavata TaxID=317549 RepID=A0A6S7I3K0_PARCT|nr:Tyrosine recombinase [Paramuricea clavata]